MYSIEEIRKMEAEFIQENECRSSLSIVYYIALVALKERPISNWTPNTVESCVLKLAQKVAHVDPPMIKRGRKK